MGFKDLGSCVFFVAYPACSIPFLGLLYAAAMAAPPSPNNTLSLEIGGGYLQLPGFWEMMVDGIGCTSFFLF